MTIQKLNPSTLKAPPESGEYILTDGTYEIPVRYKKGSGKILIVLFHGASDRKTREFPTFPGFISGSPSFHQLSIADATLGLDDDIAAAWYTGAEKFPLQSILPKLVKALSRVIRTPRRIYVGGSSGGYAALYYSWADSSSACVAVNPQTTIENYIPSVIQKYLETAWPNATSIEQVKKKCTLDLSTVYAKRFNNTVIYLQSTGDMRHFSTQMPKFLTVALQNTKKFILQCSYWGIPHHSGSIPPNFYHNWVKAAALSPTFDRQQILDNYHTLVTRNTAASAKPANKAQAGHSYDPQDIERANFLRDQQLQS